MNSSSIQLKIYSSMLLRRNRLLKRTKVLKKTNSFGCSNDKNTDSAKILIYTQFF